MSAALAVVVAATVVAAGVAPLVAVHLGGRAFDPKHDEAPPTCTDDTIEIPRVTSTVDPHMY